MSAVVALTRLTSVGTDISASSEESIVILEPKPSTDPNDPLVSTENYPPDHAWLTHVEQNWPKWRKHLNFAFVSYYTMMVLAL